MKPFQTLYEHISLIAHLSKSFVHLYSIDSHPNNTSKCKIMKKKGHYVTNYFVLCPSDSNNVEKVNRNQTDANISQNHCIWLLSNLTAKLRNVYSYCHACDRILWSRFVLAKLMYFHYITLREY